MNTSMLRKTLSFTLAVVMLLSGFSAIAGTLEASAATPYWKNFTVKSTAHTNNTLKWKMLTATQQKKISGIAIFQGANKKNLKCVKRIKKTCNRFVNKNVKAGTKYCYIIKTYTTKKVNQKQYYNKSTKKWLAKKPASKNWGKCPSGKYKGKKTRTVKVTQYKYANASPLKWVTTKKKTASNSLTVKDDKFKVSMSDLDFDMTDTTEIIISASSSGRITWTSINTSVATVTEGGKTRSSSHSGIITLKGPGKTIITATNYDGQRKSETLTVSGKTVKQLSSGPNYSYKLKCFNQAYTSSNNDFFLETDNPSNKLWDHSRSIYDSSRENGDYIDIEVIDAKGNDACYYITEDRGYPVHNDTIRLSPDGLFDDIQYTRWYRNEYNTLHGEVQGGYLGRFCPPSSGDYTLRIREYSVNDEIITATKEITLGTIRVLDSAKEYKAWMQQIIDNNTNASMTKPEKMQAICKYLISIAHYPDCLSAEGMDAYKARYGESHGWAYIKYIVGSPSYVSHIWNSYTSPYCLENFGEMIGYPVRSMYYDYPQGSSEWYHVHAYAESVEDGTRYSFCPIDKTEYDLDEINLINPITYKNYWLVLE